MTASALLTALALGTAVPPPMPPPASIQVGDRTRQLAYGSYFWAGYRADFGPPAARRDLPRIVLRRGQRARFRFGVDPDRLELTVAGRRFELTAQKTALWRARRGGLAVLEVRYGKSRATYLARFVLAR